MSQVPPSDQPRLGAHEAEGKVPALAVWALYILSIPSAALFVPIGVMVAYAARSGTTGVPRAHIDEQIRFFWSVIWWTVGCWIGIAISIPLVVVFGLGLITGAIFGLGLFLLHIWFTVKSIICLLHLLADKAP